MPRLLGSCSRRGPSLPLLATPAARGRLAAARLLALRAAWGRACIRNLCCNRSGRGPGRFGALLPPRLLLSGRPSGRRLLCSCRRAGSACRGFGCGPLLWLWPWLLRCIGRLLLGRAFIRGVFAIICSDGAGSRCAQVMQLTSLHCERAVTVDLHAPASNQDCSPLQTRWGTAGQARTVLALCGSRQAEPTGMAASTDMHAGIHRLPTAPEPSSELLPRPRRSQAHICRRASSRPPLGPCRPPLPPPATAGPSSSDESSCTGGRAS